MSVVLTLIAIAALALCLLIWLISRLRADARPASSATAGAGGRAVRGPGQNGVGGCGADTLRSSLRRRRIWRRSPAGCEFSPPGRARHGGPIYGDVLCADGVYLPHVWEMDMHTSYDGRWLRTGFMTARPPIWSIANHVAAGRSASRKASCWMPSTGACRAGVARASTKAALPMTHVIMSDASFEAWLGEHMGAAAAPAAGGGSLGAGRLPAGRSRPAHADLPQPAQPSPCR
jgi:hypothetical protein